MRTFRLALGSAALFVTAACGVASTEAKTSSEEGDLIGGEVQDAPYMATVVLRGSCTAARVGKRHLLTAAHCLWKDGDLDPAFASGTTLKYTNDPALNDPSLATGKDGKTTTNAPPPPSTDGGADDTDGGDADGGDVDAGPAPLPETVWKTAKIEKVEISPSWKKDCATGCENATKLTKTAESDVAVILLESDLPGDLPTVPVDLDPVLPGDTLNLVGYGCETAVNEASKHDYSQSRAKVQNTTSLPQAFFMHTGGVAKIGQADIAASLDGRYFLSPGPALNPGQAGLCPGDSGGPVYRAGDRPAIVGVNANYAFYSDLDNGYANPVTNWHTRLDEANANGVGAWLEKLGVETTRSCSQFKSGCTDTGYTGAEYLSTLRGNASFDAGAPPSDGGL